MSLVPVIGLTYNLGPGASLEPLVLGLVIGFSCVLGPSLGLDE